jgi:hypothetical protein
MPCLSEGMVGELTKCIRTDMYCADICTVTAAVLSRHTGYDANITRDPAGMRHRLQCLRGRMRAPRRHPRALPDLRRSLPELRAGMQQPAR